MSSTIYAFANQKGGVGKTTTAVNLGAFLAWRGRRVLLIDLDPQGNASSSVGVDRFALPVSVYDVFMGETPLRAILAPSAIEHLVVAPSTPVLASAELELANTTEREFVLRRALYQVDYSVAPPLPSLRDEFDHILIDCPPSLGVLTVNALTAADFVIVPVQCEYLALEGLAQGRIFWESLSFCSTPGNVDAVCLMSRIPGLDVVIANKTLTDFPIAAGADEDRALKLKTKIDAATGYDFVVFDSPPSLGLITINIMVAAKEIVIPVNMTFLALDGCAEIVETVEAVREGYDCPDLRVSLVVPVLYRNTRLANAILEKLREFFAERLSSTIVGYNVAIDEAQSYGQTIWEYAPRSRGAELLEALAKEIHGAV